MRVSIKLYDYQKEIVKYEGNEIFIDWSRGMGKTFTVVNYIVEHRPKSVFYEGFIKDIKSKFDEIKKGDRDFENSLLSYEANNDKITLKYTNGQETKVIFGSSLSNESYKYRSFDLHITEDNSWCENIASEKVIVTCSINVFSKMFKTRRELVKDDAFESIRDYRNAPNGYYNIHKLVEDSSRYTKGFYRDMAILDKSPLEDISFDQFRDSALQSLQKQFLDTSASKDTVMTRKNLLEMIKDLKSM